MKNKLTIDVTEICMCFIKTLKVSEQGTATDIACNLQSRWMGISLASVGQGVCLSATVLLTLIGKAVNELDVV